MKNFKSRINSNSGHLPLYVRVELMKGLSSVQKVNIVFYECVKKVYSIWEEAKPNDPFLNPIFNSITESIVKENKNLLLPVTHLKNYFESLPPELTNVAMAVYMLHYSIQYDAAFILDIEEYDQEDDIAFDWEQWNPDFYASMAYSKGNPFNKDGNTKLRKEFWEWYLTLVQAVYNDSYEFSKYPLQIFQPTQNKFNRQQTYSTENINNILNHVVELILEDFHNDSSDVSWQKIIVKGVNMRSGISMKAFYIDNNNEKHKIKLKYYLKDNENSTVDLMNIIKQEMYAQNKQEGAWVSYEMEIIPNKMIQSIQFNYDNNNELKKDLDEYIEEFETYPRSKNFTPDWWQSLLKGKTNLFLD